MAQLVDRFRDELLQPGAAGGVLHPSVLDGLVRQENAGGERLRPEEREERPELVLDDERVAVASAGGKQRNRRSKKGRVVDEVDEVLEEAGVGAFVDRRADDEKAGAFDCLQRILDLRRSFGAGSDAKVGHEVRQIDKPGLRAGLRRDTLHDRFHDKARPGWRAGASR